MDPKNRCIGVQRHRAQTNYRQKLYFKRHDQISNLIYLELDDFSIRQYSILNDDSSNLISLNIFRLILNNRPIFIISYGICTVTI